MFCKQHLPCSTCARCLSKFLRAHTDLILDACATLFLVLFLLFKLLQQLKFYGTTPKDRGKFLWPAPIHRPVHHKSCRLGRYRRDACGKKVSVVREAERRKEGLAIQILSYSTFHRLGIISNGVLLVVDTIFDFSSDTISRHRMLTFGASKLTKTPNACKA